MISVAGVEVHETGQGDTVVLMLHGWPDTYRLWDAQVDALQSQYRCVRFTLPGFQTSGKRRAFGLAEMIDVIRQVTESTSPDQPVILLAHDWGCFFGYQFVLAHPTRVSRVIGLDIGDAGSTAHVKSLTIRAKLMTAGYQLWLAAAWRLGRRIGDPMTRIMARSIGAPANAAAVGSHMNYPYYIQWARAHGSYRAARTFKPTVPMLFIYGKRKPFMFHSAAWAHIIENSKASGVVAMNTGHWVMSEAPEELNQVLLAWLSNKH